MSGEEGSTLCVCLNVAVCSNYPILTVQQPVGSIWSRPLYSPTLPCYTPACPCKRAKLEEISMEQQRDKRAVGQARRVICAGYLGLPHFKPRVLVGEYRCHSHISFLTGMSATKREDLHSSKPVHSQGCIKTISREWKNCFLEGSPSKIILAASLAVMGDEKAAQKFDYFNPTLSICQKIKCCSTS